MHVTAAVVFVVKSDGDVHRPLQMLAKRELVG